MEAHCGTIKLLSWSPKYEGQLLPTAAIFVQLNFPRVPYGWDKLRDVVADTNANDYHVLILEMLSEEQKVWDERRNEFLENLVTID